jgi:HSP20 family protein
MRNSKKITNIMVLSFIFFWVFFAPASAQESRDTSSLQEQIRALQKRVEALEAENRALKDRGRVSPRNRWAWDPFEEINRMQQEMDRMFQHSFGRSGDKQGMFSSNMSFDYDFDIQEKDDGYEIRFDMAGLDKEKIDISINERSLTVTGEHSRQDTEEGPDRYFSSRSFGSFMKTIPLPEDADTTEVKSEQKDDTLIIFIAKKGVTAS